jgi:peptide/nickel transport system ATP-binding protein
LQDIPGIIPDLIDPPEGCRFHPRCEHVMEHCRVVVPAASSIVAQHRVYCHLYAEEAEKEAGT